MRPINRLVRPTRRLALCAMLMLQMLWGAISARADTVTLNFSDGVYQSSFDNGLPQAPYDTYVENGFSFQTPQAPGQHLDLNNLVLYWHEGPANTVNNVITLSYAGGAFNLLSFDLVELANNAFPTFNPAMTVIASNGSQFTTQNEALGTFNIGWTDLDWVTFDINGQLSSSGNAWMDNVVVQTVAVSEPQTFALLLAGLGIFGFMTKSLSRAKVG